jgi:PAS domain S-box-containing protein
MMEQLGAEEINARLAAILDGSEDAIIGRTLDGTVTSWNQAAKRLFGYTAEEMIGRSLAVLALPDQPEAGLVLQEEIRKAESVSSYETRRRRKDGELIEVSVKIVPVLDADGRIGGAVEIARDISQRRQAEAEMRELTAAFERRVEERTRQLAEANEELKSFAYSVAHDLRAPLRSMRGFGQALLEDYGEVLDDAGRQYARRIIDAAARLDVLINDLLQYSRLTREEISIEPVELAVLLPQVVSQLKASIKERGAELLVIQPLPRVLGQRSVLMQVFANLIGNALKFVAAEVQPRIIVKSETRDGFAWIWVQDNGIGIEPKYHARIFNIFERLHSEKTYLGTGIGLAIVRKGVDRIGGRVGVESEPGRGSRFWVQLRLSEMKNGAS